MGIGAKTLIVQAYASVKNRNEHGLRINSTKVIKQVLIVTPG